MTDSQWLGWHKDVTGFVDKRTYKEWCRNGRLRQLSAWVKTYAPKLVICTGKTYANDFFHECCDDTMNRLPDVETSFGKPIQCAVTNDRRTLVVVTYFPGGRHGLNSVPKLTETGRCLAALLRRYGLDQRPYASTE